MKLDIFKLSAMSIVAMSMAACSADNELEELSRSGKDDKSAPIVFTVQTGNTTRAASSYSSNLRPSHFSVAAIDGNENYFGARPDFMTSDDDGYTWNSANTRYWPLDRPADWRGLTFYAFVDDSGSDVRSAQSCFDITSGTPMFRGYEVKSDARLQSDLMYAVAKDVKRNSFGGDVRLSFRHALSQICFTAQNNHPLYKDIEILSIEVGGIKGKGDYTFPSKTTETGFARPADGICGQWTIAEDAPDCVFRLSDVNMSLGATDASGRGELINISTPVYTEARAADFSNTMYLLPQAAEAREKASDAEGAYIKVKARLIPVESSGLSVEEETKYIPISINWKEGQTYIYKISWDATPISYSVTVDDFSDVEV